MSTNDSHKSWKEDADQQISDTMSSLYKLPFIQKLLDGTLPIEIFNNYIIQDILYCKRYMKALEKMGERLTEENEKNFFFKGAKGTEKLIKSMRNEYKVNEEGHIQLTGCKSYSDLEENLANKGTFGEALGILFPCYLVYDYLGSYLKENAKKENNRYINFINDLSSDSGIKKCKQYLTMIEKYAQKNAGFYDDIMRAFLSGVKKEYEFFDECYNHLE